MSELKEHLFVPYSELQEGDELTDAFTIAKSYYLKSEADKVIAEKDKELRRHKYKRCLAMSKLCHWKMGVFIYKKEKSDFYYRWYKRWLEHAEKFKDKEEAK